MTIDGCTILTVSGRYVNPLDLRPGDVCIEDIAHALSNQCRYSGHTRDFYSVAEHCCRVENLLYDEGAVAEVRLWGLLHDAAEAYLVDLPRPLKRHPGFGEVYRAAEDRAMAVIAAHFDLDPTEPDAVKQADLVLLATERRDLMPPVGEWAVLADVEPLAAPIDPWEPFDALATFVQSFVDLGGAV